jgi:low affinity Fe/Cu permease
MGRSGVRMPSEVSEHVSVFDRFASVAAQFVGRAAFFMFCVLLVLIWFPSIVLIRDIDTWQLIINTATTIITFLMVALLQNTQSRSDQAVQHKLNALANGLADLMSHHAGTGDKGQLAADRDELRQAVGLEEYESSSKNGSSKNGTKRVDAGRT